MAFKLTQSVRDRWRAASAPRLAALVRAGARFERGRLTGRAPGRGMIFELHPPRAAGPLRIGATGHDTVEILKQLGGPLVLCRTHRRRPGWGVDRPSGLFISTLFDADDRLEAIEFGRPDRSDDAVVHDGLDVFAVPAADLLAQLRQRTTVHAGAEEDGHAFTAPSLLLSLWRPVTPQSPDDQEARFFESVLIARPGYYDQPAERDRPSRE